MPETSPNPYDAAIADLEARIRNMQITLDTLRQLRGQGDGPGVTGPVTNVRGESEVQHDTFFGMTIADAVRKYLTMMKTTKSTAEIAAALELGGLKHSSKDFPTTVRSILGARENFLRVPNGDWGLVEWYPGMGRGKKAKVADKPTRAASKRKTTSRQKPRKSKGPTLETRIVELMKTDANKDWVSSEIASKLEAKRESIQSMLSRLAKDGKGITKAQTGYRIAKLQPTAA